MKKNKITWELVEPKAYSMYWNFSVVKRRVYFKTVLPEKQRWWLSFGWQVMAVYYFATVMFETVNFIYLSPKGKENLDFILVDSCKHLANCLQEQLGEMGDLLPFPIS